MSTTVKGNYAQVNGINLYYEIHGQGDPLILLHGGLGAIEMFGESLPALAAGRQVIGVDLQAHGRTADIDRPITYEAMADDIGGLIDHLGLEKVDVMGYSLGGGTAIQVAIRHGEKIRKLVVVSSPFRRISWYPEVLAGMAAMGTASADAMKPSPIYQLYAQIAPRVEDWPVLLIKVSALLGRDYDWSKEVAAFTMPVLLIFGDADSVRPSEIMQFFELVGGGKGDAGWDGSGMPKSRLAVLPAMSHYNVFATPAVIPTVTSFLDA